MRGRSEKPIRISRPVSFFANRPCFTAAFTTSRIFALRIGCGGVA
jgi:hypothetical protein